MGIFNRDKIKEEDLEQIKHLNTTSKTGGVYSSNPSYDFESFFDNENLKNDNWIYFYSLTNALKNYYVGKFKIEGLDEDTLTSSQLISTLYRFGSVLVFKLGKKTVFSSYVVKTYDIMGRPINVKPIPFHKSSEIETNELEIGKNCEILTFEHNAGFFGMNNTLNSIYWLNFPLFQKLTSDWNEIKNDLLVSLERIALPNTFNSVVKENLKNAIYNGDRIIELDDFDKMKLNGDNVDIAKLILKFESRQKDLWEAHNSTITELRMLNGIKGNDQIDKKERVNTSEVEKGNELNSQIEKARISTLEKCIEKVNNVLKLDLELEINEESKLEIQEKEKEEEELENEQTN